MAHAEPLLPAGLVQPAVPLPLPAPRWLWANAPLAAALGLERLGWPGGEHGAFAQALAGAAPWPGGLESPQASAYAGHQFGRFSARLGDGRVMTVAVLDAPAAGGRIELQLKGAGPTPFARGHDGRAVLRSALREALACEALHGLGVPTTRALALLVSPLQVERDGVAEPVAVLARSAPDFTRFGHFEFLARSDAAGLEAPERIAALQALADRMIERHHPALAGRPERHAAWLHALARRHAELVARWQVLGFCHGVLNTDNCSVLGLTLDYGPFGFLERFRPEHVGNASDTEGRYRWSAQPAVMRWNLQRLLQACAPLLGATPPAREAAGAAIEASFDRALAQALRRGWAARLGLRAAADETPRQVAQRDDLVLRALALLQRSRADFTLSWCALADAMQAGERLERLPPAHPGAAPPPDPDGLLREALLAWQADWQALAAAQGGPDRALLERSNPRVVLRNALAQTAIDAATAGDVAPLQRLMTRLARPFERDRDDERDFGPAQAAAPEIGCSA